MTSEDNYLVQVINQELERTIPIIHKGGKNNYLLIQRTKSGIVRIMARVTSETIARKIVNDFIRKMKSHPDASNHTG